MIRLLELYPEHLNLNGDRGNLVVLKRRLEWAGVEVQLMTHRGGDPLPNQAPDVVLLGHGSPAAWRQIYSDLARIAPTLQTWIDSSTQMLAVSSGFAALHGLLQDLPNKVSKVDRVSKFEVAEFGDTLVVGYKNTDLDLPTIQRFGNLVGTVLHGPVLAKNIQLADEMLAQLRTDREGFGISKELERFVDDARKLAIELSSE